MYHASYLNAIYIVCDIAYRLLQNIQENNKEISASKCNITYYIYNVIINIMYI